MSLTWGRDIFEPEQEERFGDSSNQHLTRDSGYHSLGPKAISQIHPDFSSYESFGTVIDPSPFGSPNLIDLVSSTAHTEPPPNQQSTFSTHREYHSENQLSNSFYGDSKLNASIDALVSGLLSVRPPPS